MALEASPSRNSHNSFSEVLAGEITAGSESLAAWIGQVQSRGALESLFGLETWLKGIRSFFNLENIPLTEAEKSQLLMRSFAPEIRVVRQALQICEKYACAVLSPEINGKVEFEEFADIWSNIFQDDPEVNEVIVYLKARGMPVYLLSNTNELHFSHILNKFPIVHLMDEWILSFEVGVKKPHRRIFEAVFEKSDVRRESVLYIDDVDLFVASARQSGMQGLHFREAADLWKVLKENFQ